VELKRIFIVYCFRAERLFCLECGAGFFDAEHLAGLFYWGLPFRARMEGVDPPYLPLPIFTPRAQRLSGK
jgi:hypothetical protein